MEQFTLNLLTSIYGPTLVIAAGVFAFVLGLLPIAHHLWFGLSERKREITDLLGDAAVCAYFDQFYHAQAEDFKKAPRNSIERIYDERFGARTFLLPIVVYIAMLALAVLALMTVIGAKLPGGPVVALLDPIAAYALAGAYLWVVYDLIARYRQRNLVPSAIYYAAFRIAIIVPLGYALAATLSFSETIAGAAAFLLGSFPTSTLFLLARRHGEKLFGLAEAGADKKTPELETLQGVDQAVREAFSDVGVTTILQLAYDDPIRLAMRTNLPFYFVLDLVSQALVAIYVDTDVARRLSVRGSVEASTLYRRCEEGDAASCKTLAELAAALKLSQEAFNVILYQISEDPCSKFISAIWDAPTSADGQDPPERGDGADRVFFIRATL